MLYVQRALYDLEGEVVFELDVLIQPGLGGSIEVGTELSELSLCWSVLCLLTWRS